MLPCKSCHIFFINIYCSTMQVDGDLDTTIKFVDSLNIPYIAPSFGGCESIVDQPAIMSYWYSLKFLIIWLHKFIVFLFGMVEISQNQIQSTLVVVKLQRCVILPHMLLKWSPGDVARSGVYGCVRIKGTLPLECKDLNCSYL